MHWTRPAELALAFAAMFAADLAAMLAYGLLTRPRPRKPAPCPGRCAFLELKLPRVKAPPAGRVDVDDSEITRGRKLDEHGRPEYPHGEYSEDGLGE